MQVPEFHLATYSHDNCNEVQGSRAAIGLTFSSALGSSCKRAAGATTVQSDTCMGMVVI